MNARNGMLLGLALLAQTHAGQVMSWISYENCTFGFMGMQTAINNSAVSRIGLQLWLLESDGSLKRTDQNSCDINKIIKPTAQRGGVKLLLTPYNATVDAGWDWTRVEAALKPGVREKLVRNLLDTLDFYGLDGVDIDLEGNGDGPKGDAVTRKAFQSLVNELSDSLKVNRKGKLLTVNTFAAGWNAPNDQWWADWVGKIDAVHVMGYEEVGKGGRSGWNTYDNRIQALVKAGYTKDQAFMGIPASYDSSKDSLKRALEWLGVSIEENINDIAARGANLAVWDIAHTDWWRSKNSVYASVQRLLNGDYSAKSLSGSNSWIFTTDTQGSSWTKLDTAGYRSSGGFKTQMTVTGPAVRNAVASMQVGGLPRVQMRDHKGMALVYSASAPLRLEAWSNYYVDKVVKTKDGRDSVIKVLAKVDVPVRDKDGNILKKKDGTDSLMKVNDVKRMATFPLPAASSAKTFVAWQKMVLDKVSEPIDFDVLTRLDFVFEQPGAGDFAIESLRLDSLAPVIVGGPSSPTTSVESQQSGTFIVHGVVDGGLVLEGRGSVQLRVFGMDGALLWREEPSLEGRTRVGLPSLPQGQYFVEVARQFERQYLLLRR